MNDMTNRQRIALAVERSESKLLQDEIRYQLEDVEYEEWPDVADVLNNTLDVAECNDDRRLIDACRRVLIDAGYYRRMSEDEIRRTYVTRGKAWDFSIGGAKYRCVEAWATWIER